MNNPRQCTYPGCCISGGHYHRDTPDGEEVIRTNESTLICPECGEPRPDDDRVKAGMKCTQCAYGQELMASMIMRTEQSEEDE